MTSFSSPIRSRQDLLQGIEAGLQPRYLMFWGHQPPAGGGVGKSCLSQWYEAPFNVDGEHDRSAEHAAAQQPSKWPGLNLLGFALMDARDVLRARAA